MKATVKVDAGVCGFQTVIEAEADDSANVTFQIKSGCDKARGYAEALMARGPVDGYGELGEGLEGMILKGAREGLGNFCSSCVVPIGAFKAMQVAAGLALPKDVTLKISAG